MRLSTEEELHLSRKVNEDLMRLLTGVLLLHHNRTVVVDEELMNHLARVPTPDLLLETRYLPKGGVQITSKIKGIEIRNDS